MEETVFGKIVRGDIPCHKIYEDDKTLGFLDLYPQNEGHALVIPKINPTEFVWDMDDEIYQACMATAKKVALRQRKILPYKYIHQAIVGVDVPYAHIHLIPFDQVEQIRQSQTTDQPNHAKLAKLADKLRFYK